MRHSKPNAFSSQAIAARGSRYQSSGPMVGSRARSTISDRLQRGVDLQAGGLLHLFAADHAHVLAEIPDVALGVHDAIGARAVELIRRPIGDVGALGAGVLAVDVDP